MTEKTTYVCDLCGTEHTSSAAAQLCEKSHVTVTGIKKVFYPKNSANFRYPQKIVLKMEDGNELIYERA